MHSTERRSVGSTPVPAPLGPRRVGRATQAMTTEPEIPLDAVAALSTHLLSDGTLDEICLRVCEATVQHVRGAEEASVTLLSGGRSTQAISYGATSELSLAADRLQYEAGTGPCLDAARTNQPVVVEDMLRDDRWKGVLEGMAREGIRSSLSIPLPIRGEAIGSLNIYSGKAAAFGADSLGLGDRLAIFAAVAVASAVAHVKAAEQAENLQLAMESRAVIEQAKGIVMARVGCDADAAFQLLVEQSQHQNRKLREIAAELVSRVVSDRPEPD